MTIQTNSNKGVLFEGLTQNEILALSQDEIDGLILNGRPIVFRAGSATVLGEFRRENMRLIIELAQIDGGGEGVLLALGSLARRFASQHNLEAIEWLVHATNCAKPNLKLRRTLDRRGFVIREVPNIGSVYYLLEKAVRRGWTNAAKEIAANGDDALVWPQFPNEDDSRLS